MAPDATVRPLRADDAADACALYDALTAGPTGASVAAFEAVIKHPGTSVLGANCQGRIVAMVTLHILPNVAWGGRPYALIENVITAPDMRRLGYGRLVMSAAIDMAWAKNTYKIMVMTNPKRGAVGFYQALGFTSTDKCAMTMRRA
ncbi:MAG: GNAT family N-acetyltransferase [Albidovulum sp.]